jgi:hypothetical protein
MVSVAATAITVSRREAEGASLEEEISALESVAETGVWAKSRYGEAVWPADGSPYTLPIWPQR